MILDAIDVQLSHKQCSVCHLSFPASSEYFAKRSPTSARLYTVCRACRRIQRRVWRSKNAEKVKVSRKLWAEAHPGYHEAKTLEWRKNNQEHFKALTKRWRQNNLDKIHARISEWKKQNPEKRRAYNARRRARQHSAPGWHYTTAQHIQWRWEFYGNRCYICGNPAEATDHVIPLAKGGSHWPANLRPVCWHCNSQKGAKWGSPTLV